MASEEDTTSQVQASLGVLKDVREIQRMRWIQKKEEDGAASIEDASNTPSSPSMQPVTVTPQRQEEGTASPLLRIHLLPFTEADTAIGEKGRIDVIAPELKRKRAAQEVVRLGDIISHEQFEFAVTSCEPEEGFFGTDTEFFFDGPPLACFEKIQFSCWGPTEMTPDMLFSECISPFFKDGSRTYGSKCVKLLNQDQVIRIGEVSLHVEATLPAGMGVVTKTTEIFANWDKQAEFEKIHIVPFQDTLPRAYEYDIFNDYLRPYLQRHPYKKMQCNDLFTWQGVQFKVVACEPPEAPARVGRATTIFCEGSLHPSLRNLLPPELLSQVAQLPPGLQMLLLNTERTTRELEDMLSHRRGLFEETLAQLERFNWPPPSEEATSQSTCMICLGDFRNGDECRRLPCRHVFHSSCVDEWLRRCTDCPICKANVDRAIRNY